LAEWLRRGVQALDCFGRPLLDYSHGRSPREFEPHSLQKVAFVLSQTTTFFFCSCL